jgi:hypothetical protein
VRRVVLLFVAVVMVAVGALLWVDAGTRHMDSLPQSGVLFARRDPLPGPNRLPARLVWAGSAVVVIAAFAPTRRRPIR